MIELKNKASREDLTFYQRWAQMEFGHVLAAGKELQPYNIEERVVVKTIKGRDKKGRAIENFEYGRLMGWEGRTLFIRFGCKDLDAASLQSFFARHGGQGENFKGVRVPAEQVAFAPER